MQTALKSGLPDKFIRALLDAPMPPDTDAWDTGVEQAAA